MKNSALFNEANRATYCPEDNKLRLYVGRVPREEYDALRAEGWQATAKQDCDFSAVWTVNRKNTAESYAGIIEDEDASPQDRAADRAERFSGYLDKRLSEATGHADRYDAGPQAHGFQSYARAVKSADRHDRIASRAVDAWSKAEYWQARTAGVIANALHRSAPGVRMGRIKTIEAEKRQAEKRREEAAARYRQVEAIMANPGEALASLAARFYDGDEAEAAKTLVSEIAGHGKIVNPLRPQDPPAYHFEHLRTENPPTVSDYAAQYLRRHAAPGSPEWEETGTAQSIRHCELRLAYEMQMLEAQGGRAAMVEMEVGGWIGGYQIRKVNKSPATGRVVSVQVMGKGRKYDRRTGEEKHFESLETLNIERASVESYRAPTEEDKASLAAIVKAEKAAKPKSATVSLVNPTLEDAERLQALINERHVADWIRRHGQPTGEHYKPKTAEVCAITQATYSANSSGSYAKAETRGLCGNGQLEEKFSNMWSQSAQDRAKARGPAVCKIRITGYDPVRIIHITDKPAKPLPASVWQAYAAPVSPESVEA